MNKIFKAILLLLIPFVGFSQQITGTVTDANSGEALIGVNILEEGTSVGTITDIDGSFEITVTNDKPVLVITYIGYKDQIIPVDGRASIDIALAEDAQQLDEVVVIGYGTQKKKVVTGAIAKVDGKDLEDMQVTRLEGALQGRTSGVTVIQDSGQPGAGASIRVRGVTGFTGRNPLFVVDGVIIGGGIDYLNPGDIESIEVLKDAAASSIYGTRASNGVVIVTTKSGVKGKTLINYNGFYGTQRPWRKLSLLNATEYATLRNESSIASGGPVLFENPSQYGEGTDWQAEIFNYDAPLMNHEVNFSGGSEKSDFYVSLAYNDAKGIVSTDNSRYQRYNARVNSNHTLSSRLKIGTNVAYSRVKATGVNPNSEFGGPLSRAINLDPITPVFETDEETLTSPVYAANPVVTNGEGKVYGISPYVTSEVLNPIAALEVLQGYGWSDKVVASGNMSFQILNGLSYNGRAGADLAFWGNENFTPIFYLNATNRNDITSYTRGHNRGLSSIFSHNLSYDKKSDVHSYNLLVGASIEQNKGEGISGAVKNIPATSIEDASLGFANTIETQSYGGYEYEEKTNSIFGRVTYNYKEKYLLLASVRRDGSSRFGPDRKFGVFPGASIGWVVSEEDFINTNSNLNFLKLRASWGTAGTSNIAPFGYLPRIFTGSNYTFGLEDNLTIGATPGQLANPDYRWEESEEINFGIDATLFKHLDVTLDAYSKKAKGILRISEVPDYVGFSGPSTNLATIDNEGVEFSIRYDDQVSEDFAYEVSFNGAYTQNTVISITDDVTFIAGQGVGPQNEEVTRALLGQPFEQFFGLRTDGLFQNQDEVRNHVNSDGELIQPNAAPGDIRFMDLNGDGKIDANDKTQIGDPTPTWAVGFNMGIDYKAFDLQVFGQGVFGNEIYNATRRLDLTGANLPGSALGRWTGEGTSNHFPRLIDTDPNSNFTNSSDFFVESGAYFRIKNLQVGYTVPEHASKMVGINRARLYFSLNNVITFTNYSGYDPEIPGGVDRGIYPQARSIIFGGNITF